MCQCVCVSVRVCVCVCLCVAVWRANEYIRVSLKLIFQLAVRQREYRQAAYYLSQWRKVSTPFRLFPALVTLFITSNTKLLTSASSSPPRSRQFVATQTWNSRITFTQGVLRTIVQIYAINTDNGSLLSCSDELPQLLWVTFCWPSFVGSSTSERTDELGAAAITRSIFVVDKSVSGLGCEFDSREAYRA